MSGRRETLFGAAVALLASACATKTITITSEPPGAEIYLDGQYYGTTDPAKPLTRRLNFNGNRDYELVAKKDGYEEGHTTIGFRPRDLTSYHLKLNQLEAVSVDLLQVEPTETRAGELELKITRKPTLAYLETIERSPHASAVSQVTMNLDNGVQISAPVLSPSTELMVFTEFIEEQGGGSYSNIFKVVPGTQAKTCITYGKWLDLFPAFTPDGAAIVFSSNRTSQNRTLWRVPVGREGGLTKITSSLADDFSPTISPDGAKVIYASIPRTDKDSQIWSMEAGFPTQLREGEQPCVAPDGKQIAFVRRDKTSSRRQLWLMNTAGGEETQLTANLDYDVIDPRWSPDGNWIGFASDEGLDSERLHNFDIWVVRPDGTRKTQLTTNGSRDDSPCWDHTGVYIYFRSNRGGFWNIWRFKPQL